MPVQLTHGLRENLTWLASNWEAKQLQHVSPFNERKRGLMAVLL